MAGGGDEALPAEHLLLRFETIDYRTRRITLEPHGDRYEQLLRALQPSTEARRC